MTALYLSRLHFPVSALGPGRRIGLWVQGCSIQCPGCVSLDTWATGKGLTTVRSVCETLEPWLAEADGLTISGGEPLQQARAMEQLLSWVRPRLEGEVMLFSGYPEREVLAHPLILSGLVDAVVPEPYKASAPQTRALRGSDNQPLIPLTDLGRDRYAPLIDAPPNRRLDIMFDGEGVWLAGIPAPGDLAAIEAALELEGHRISTSADKRTPTTPE